MFTCDVIHIQCDESASLEELARIIDNPKTQIFETLNVQKITIPAKASLAYMHMYFHK